MLHNLRTVEPHGHVGDVLLGDLNDTLQEGIEMC
jgi:hypothetical protein